jgi:hypothetical protein
VVTWLCPLRSPDTKSCLKKYEMWDRSINGLSKPGCDHENHCSSIKSRKWHHNEISKCGSESWRSVDKICQQWQNNVSVNHINGCRFQNREESVEKERIRLRIFNKKSNCLQKVIAPNRGRFANVWT